MLINIIKYERVINIKELKLINQIITSSDGTKHRERDFQPTNLILFLCYRYLLSDLKALQVNSGNFFHCVFKPKYYAPPSSLRNANLFRMLHRMTRTSARKRPLSGSNHTFEAIHSKMPHLISGLDLSFFKVQKFSPA